MEAENDCKRDGLLHRQKRRCVGEIFTDGRFVVAGMWAKVHSFVLTDISFHLNKCVSLHFYKGVFVILHTFSKESVGGSLIKHCFLRFFLNRKTRKVVAKCAKI